MPKWDDKTTNNPQFDLFRRGHSLLIGNHSSPYARICDFPPEPDDQRLTNHQIRVMNTQWKHDKSKQDTILEFAARNGRTQLLRNTLDNNLHLVNQTEALSDACLSKQLEIVRILICEYGEDTNRKTIHGYPIHKAIEGGDIEIIRFLIQHGAKLDTSGFLSETPLKCCLRKMKGLFDTIDLNYIPILQLLIDSGANLNDTSGIHKDSPREFIEKINANPEQLQKLRTILCEKKECSLNELTDMMGALALDSDNVDLLILAMGCLNITPNQHEKTTCRNNF